MSTQDFQKKYAAIMETLIQTAIAETTVIFESIVGDFKVEFDKIKTENQHLKLKFSKSERASVYDFNGDDHQKRLAKSDKDVQKRETEIQGDSTSSSTLLTEQRPPLRMMIAHHCHDSVANALHDHNCYVRVKKYPETAVIVAKEEPAFKQKTDESLVDIGQSFLSTETSLDVTVEDTQMVAEPTIWLQHSLSTQPGAEICDDEISEGCQDRATTVSMKKFLPSAVEDQQLLNSAVKLHEKKQMDGATFQNEFKGKTVFPQQTNDNLQEPVHSSVDSPQFASFKKIDFCDQLRNEQSTLHPEDVHLRSGQSPRDEIESQPFVKDGWTQTDNIIVNKQSVNSTISLTKKLKENLPAVVKLERIPIPLSTGESIFVSRPLKSASLDCWSLKSSPTKDVSSTPAPTALLKIPKKNEFLIGKTTSKPEQDQIFDLLRDCALPNGSEEETQSTTFEDTGECLLPTSKDQYSAQKAASAVAQVPKEAFSETVRFIASCAETSKSVKRERVLASLQSHMKRHIQAKRTKMSTQTETQFVNCETPRLACDRSNHQRKRIISEAAQGPTAVVPTTTVSCQKKTIGDFSKFKANNEPSTERHQNLHSSSASHDSQNLGSSAPTSRRSGKPKLSPSVKKDFVDSTVPRKTRKKSGSTKNTTVQVVCSKKSVPCISWKGSKLTLNASKKKFEAVTTKARKMAKSNNGNGLKMQTRVKGSCNFAPSSSQLVPTPHKLLQSQRTSPKEKKGAQLSEGEKTKLLKPPDDLPASGTPNPGTEPHVVSPTDPLSFIGSRLLKNQCGICGQILGSKPALEKHVSLHTNDQPFSCSLCGKNFTDSASLKRHSRVHRNGRIHVCQQCGKGFVYGFCLTKHINMVHKHMRPFVCHICNKGCFSKLDLEAHIRMHTGEKPFHCHLCNKKFIRRVNLNVHLRRHNGEKRHWCSYCGKGFLEYNHLKKHKYIHTGEKPHCCPNCSKRFTQSAHLKKHLKNVHKAK